MGRSPRLVLVTDPAYAEARVEDVVARVGAALPRGDFAVLARDKERPPDAVASLVRRLRAATSSAGARLFVHTDVTLALAVGADGVHFGSEASSASVGAARSAMPGAWLSVATHSDDEVRSAAASGADAVLVSPVFAAPGKGPARGTAALASARVAAPGVAVFALGGVDGARAGECRRAGADGVAVIRALLGATDPVAEACAIHAALGAKMD